MAVPKKTISLIFFGTAFSFAFINFENFFNHEENYGVNGIGEALVTLYTF